MGAIFARGSCGVLKWTAVLGAAFAVAFTLGAGEAAAQPRLTATTTAVTYTPDEAVITVKLSEPVFSTGTVPTAAFGVTVDGNPVTVSGHNVPRTQGLASSTITLTLGQTLQTTNNVLLSYTAPGSPNDIFSAADVTKTLASFAGQNALETDISPMFPSSVLPTTFDNNFRRGTAIDAFTLASATGGNGDLTYRIDNVPDGLPDGLMFSGGTRTISGTPAPTAIIVQGGNTVTYVVTDSDAAVTLAEDIPPGPETDTATFTLIVTDVPNRPAAPTVSATGSPTELDVTWTAPPDNNRPITQYDLRYSSDNGVTWSNPVGYVEGTQTLLRVPAAGTYSVQVRAMNLEGHSVWSPSGTGTTGNAPGARGQITKFDVTGGSKKTIGGVERHHVPEGAQNVGLEVTVQWRNDELVGIYNTPQEINVAIRHDRATVLLPNWLSWIDDEGDVDFPNTTGAPLGRLSGVVTVTTPPESAIPEAERGSNRHVTSRTGKLAVLILHDDHEAENDAFYIEAVSSPDVNLGVTASVDKVTPLVVIEDDEAQGITVQKTAPTARSAVYEGDSGANVPVYTIAASPARVDLPLEVRLDMVDLDGVTVSAAEIALSDASLTLNADMTPNTADNSASVSVHLPASDGNRKNDDYALEASVVLYSLASGGFETINVTSLPIKVLDVHKIPLITMVNPTMSEVAEGDTIDVTFTIDRNPANTVVVDPERLQYTLEELTLTVAAGAGTDATAADYRLTSPVTIEEHSGKASDGWTQTATVTIEAMSDDDIDMETLVLDVEVAGTKAANGPGTESLDAAATIMITDGTESLVWAKTGDEVDAAIAAAMTTAAGENGLNPGEAIEILGAELFGAAADVVVDYSAASNDTAVATGSGSDRRTITVTPASAGTAMITVTATATSASGATIVDQTKPNVAQIMFAVDVVDEPLTFMVEGPVDPNISEGAPGARVTVSTNRPVSANTEVMLVRDGSSSASDADYSLEPPLVTIMAGERSGSATVTAAEDSTAEEMETLTLFLVVDGVQMADKSVTFNIWDAAVPALPIIAQLLLAAFLAVGGYRRYLRR